MASYKAISQIDCNGFDSLTDDVRYFVDSSSGSCDYFPTLDSARAKFKSEVENGNMARIVTETLHYYMSVVSMSNDGHFSVKYYSRWQTK